MSKQINDIIEFIIKERKRQGMTQKELAESTNLTQSVIARMENKKVIPRIDTILKVVEALECDFKIISSR